MNVVCIHSALNQSKVMLSFVMLIQVLLVTSVGDIDVELWSKEAPKACRNFVQLCLEGYYDGTVFHRLVHDFIVQGGDPTGTGHGGESVYGKPFSVSKQQRHMSHLFIMQVFIFTYCLFMMYENCWHVLC